MVCHVKHKVSRTRVAIQMNPHGYGHNSIFAIQATLVCLSPGEKNIFATPTFYCQNPRRLNTKNLPVFESPARGFNFNACSFYGS